MAIAVSMLLDSEGYTTDQSLKVCQEPCLMLDCASVVLLWDWHACWYCLLWYLKSLASEKSSTGCCQCDPCFSTCRVLWHYVSVIMLCRCQGGESQESYWTLPLLEWRWMSLKRRTFQVDVQSHYFWQTTRLWKRSSWRRRIKLVWSIFQRIPRGSKGVATP